MYGAINEAGVERNSVLIAPSAECLEYGERRRPRRLFRPSRAG